MFNYDADILLINPTIYPFSLFKVVVAVARLFVNESVRKISGCVLFVFGLASVLDRRLATVGNRGDNSITEHAAFIVAVCLSYCGSTR